MGDKAHDVLCSQILTDKEKKTMKTVKKNFEDFFVKCHNPIFERANFNQ